MISPKYCLDTHPLVWYFTGQPTLSVKAKLILDQVFKARTHGVIPSIALLEMYHLSLRKKRFLFPVVLRKIQLPNITIITLDKAVLTASYHLPKTLNIHDRVIAATAIVTGCVLLTKDAALRSLKQLKTAW